jgi:hypothetical protein
MPYAFPADRLSHLRGEVLRPEVAGWSREDLAEAFAQRGIGSPEDAEDFLGWVNQNVVPRLGNIAAGAAQGAAAGSVVPGWGTLLGGLVGGAAGGIMSPGGPAAAPASPRQPSVAPQPPPSSGVPAAGAQGSMSGLLAGLVNNPDMQKAIMKLMLGPGLAQPTVQLRSGEEVPVEAFAEALATVSEAALAEYASGEPEAEHARERDRSSWLEGPRRSGADVNDPVLRALVLADLLKQSTVPSVPVAAVTVPPVATPYFSPSPTTPPPTATAGPSPIPGSVGGYEPSWAPSYGLPDLSPRPLPQERYAEALRRSVAENEFLLSMESLDEGW